MPTKIRTSFRDRTSLLASLREANAIVREKLSKIDVAMSESLYPLEKNSYHFVTRMLKSNNRVERALYSLIYVAAHQSEILSAGSSYIALHFATSFLENLLLEEDGTMIEGNETALKEEYDKTVERFRAVCSTHSKSLSMGILQKHIERVCDRDKALSNALYQALEIAGLEGKIHMEDSKQPNYMVEMKAGYSFALKPFKFFLNQESRLWEAANCKVMIVDGLLDSVSELDKVLNRSAETRIPLMIVASGFSEEVVATLKMNSDRGAFNIIPVRLSSDLDGLNIAVDVATVCGCDVISSLKGEMVLYTDYDALPTVDMVRCSEKEVMIEHGTSRAAVSAHIRGLIERRSQNHAIEDISSLFDNRIKGLIANAVTIRLPNLSETKKESVRMKIDISLRTCKTMLNYGVVSPKEVFENFIPATPMDRAFKKALETVGLAVDECSTLSEFLGVSFVGKTILSMMCAKGFVENEPEFATS